jgi:hypothetical protein
MMLTNPVLMGLRVSQGENTSLPHPVGSKKCRQVLATDEHRLIRENKTNQTTNDNHELFFGTPGTLP